MTVKTIHCDRCGDVPAMEVRYDYERVRDAAGGTDTEYKTVDLCHQHTLESLHQFMVEPPKAPSECGKSAFSKWVRDYCRWKPAA